MCYFRFTQLGSREVTPSPHHTHDRCKEAPKDSPRNHDKRAPKDPRYICIGACNDAGDTVDRTF